MTINELRELARYASKRTAPDTYSLESVNAAVAEGFKSLTSSINDFMRNRYDIYSIIVENADLVVPKKVMDQFGAFADVRVVGQGDRVMFKRGPLGRNRAKKFLTQVGLAGVYEAFRLDQETFEVGMKAIGGAVTVDFERMLDGAESLGEFMDVLVEAQVDAIYSEIQKALISAAAVVNPGPGGMSVANKKATTVVSNGFDADAMVKLINTAKAYGDGATIFASPEFIAAMGPEAFDKAFTFGGNTDYVGRMSPEDINDIRMTGRIHIFRGTPVVELRQSFFDEYNTEKLVDPQFAYVLPTGGEKVVKLVLEGNTQIYDHINRDNSIEVNTYRKIGVGILTTNNWCIYKNTALADNVYDGAVGIDVQFTNTH